MRLYGLFCLVAAEYRPPEKAVLFGGDERQEHIVTRDIDFIQAQYNRSNWFPVKINRRSADLSKPARRGRRDALFTRGTTTTQKPTTTVDPKIAIELSTEENKGACNSCPAGWTASEIAEKPKCIKYAGQHSLGNAHSECRKLDEKAKLPLPTNTIENANYIVVFLQMSLGQVGGVALDLNDVKTEGTWIKTSNGQKATWLNWAEGEPNNWGRREDYVVLNVRIPGEKNWNDARETSIVDVYCELEPHCSTGKFPKLSSVF